MNKYNVKSGKDHTEKTVILLGEILTVKAAKISKKLFFFFSISIHPDREYKPYETTQR